jgi:hypothetical protein
VDLLENFNIYGVKIYVGRGRFNISRGPKPGYFPAASASVFMNIHVHLHIRITAIYKQCKRRRQHHLHTETDRGGDGEAIFTFVKLHVRVNSALPKAHNHSFAICILRYTARDELIQTFTNLPSSL